jgi:hypothetical protein
VAAVVLVDCEEESAIGGGGDAADVGWGLEWKGYGLGFEEVGDGDSVTDRWDKLGVLGNHNVASPVGGSEQVMKSVIHLLCLLGGEESQLSFPLLS